MRRPVGAHRALSSFRVVCIALTMLAANHYVTWNGTFEPYHVSQRA